MRYDKRTEWDVFSRRAAHHICEKHFTQHLVLLTGTLPRTESLEVTSLTFLDIEVWANKLTEIPAFTMLKHQHFNTVREDRAGDSRSSKLFSKPRSYYSIGCISVSFSFIKCFTQVIVPAAPLLQRREI